MTEQEKQAWSVKTCVEQLERCGYACEAGPLKLNEAFVWLIEQAGELDVLQAHNKRLKDILKNESEQGAEQIDDLQAKFQRERESNTRRGAQCTDKNKQIWKLETKLQRVREMAPMDLLDGDGSHCGVCWSVHGCDDDCPLKEEGT